MPLIFFVLSSKSTAVENLRFSSFFVFLFTTAVFSLGYQPPSGMGGGPPLVVEGARRAALVRIPYGYIKKAFALSFRHAFACHLPPQGGLAFHSKFARPRDLYFGVTLNKNRLRYGKSVPQPFLCGEWYCINELVPKHHELATP